MISHEHKCIFVHIPKCAGSSIERALGHTAADSPISEPDHRSIRMLERPVPLWAVLSSSDNLLQFALRSRHRFRPHRNSNNGLDVSHEQYRSYFKCAIVRNPWSRAYSWYKNCMRDASHRKRFGLTDTTSLREFLELRAGRGALRAQTSWLQDYRGHIPLDYIGKFENLAESFARICEAIGLAAPPLPHERKGGGEDYCEHFDEPSVRLIETLYAEEIQRFGYRFGK